MYLVLKSILIIILNFTFITYAFGAIDLTSWDYNKKSELLDRLQITEQALGDKITFARDDPRMADKLKRARDNIKKTIILIKNSYPGNWDKTREKAESLMNEYDLNEFGIYDDEDYWQLYSY
jgi:hypothetical protein